MHEGSERRGKRKGRGKISVHYGHIDSEVRHHIHYACYTPVMEVAFCFCFSYGGKGPQ